MKAKAEPKSRIILALDFPDESGALRLVERLTPDQCRLKVGKELFTRAGPAMVGTLVERGFDVFLDLKYHDIPNTVAHACQAAADLGVWMINVHALGGQRMLAAAREALDNHQAQPPLLIGVTVLTSLADEDLRVFGIDGNAGEVAERLAGLARREGLDGIVCSAQEAPRMRERFGEDFALVTPGIRPAGDAAGDQRRIMTPREAIKAGADYLVVGRAVTHSENPLEKLSAINAEIDSTAQFNN